MAVVTISRQLGSGARAIGIRAAELLGYDVVDKALITEVAREAHVDPEEVAEIDELEEPGVRGFLTRWFTMDSVANVPSASSLVDLSYHGPGGIFVPPADADKGITFREALHQVRISDRRRAAFVHRNYHVDWDDTALYHLVINSESSSTAMAASAIASAVGAMKPVT